GGTFRAAGDTQLFQFSQIATNSAGGTVDFSAATGANTVALPNVAGISIGGNSTWLGPASGSAQLRTDYSSADVPITFPAGVTLTNGLALASSTFITGYRVTGGGTLFQNASAASYAFSNAPITVVNSRFRLADIGNLGTGFPALTLDGGTLAYGG